MSIFSKFEDRVADAMDGAAGTVFKAPIEPAQIAKKAEKQMRREKLVGSGRQYAPTLYNVLVNPRDDKRLFGFYPTMASEIENYLYAKGTDDNLEFDARPLVRFIVDKGLKSGKFDVIAENVSGPIIKQLREEELEYYGINQASNQINIPASQPQAATYSRDPLDGLDVQVNPQDSPEDLDAIQDVASNSIADDSLDTNSDAIPNVAANALSEFHQEIPIRRSARGRRIVPIGNPQRIPVKEPIDSQFLDDGTLESSSQSAIDNAVLVNISQGYKFQLNLRQMTAGRGKENDITLADANASRVHVKFTQDATGKWKLTDLNSSNGTQLNGQTVNTAILRDGDQITIGMTILEFRQ
jgi:hypothetical protein